MFQCLINLSYKSHKIKTFVICTIWILLPVLLTGCGGEKTNSLSNQWKAFVEGTPSIPMFSGIDMKGKITTSSGLAYISGSFGIKTIFDTNTNTEQTAFHIAWSTKKTLDDNQKRFVSGVRYRTPQNVFLRLDTGYNNGKSAEAILIRGLFDRIRGQWVSFNPTNDDMGIITVPITFQHLFALSPTFLITDMNLIQIGQSSIVDTQPTPLPLIGSFFLRKKIKTDLKRTSLGITGEWLIKSIYHLLDPTNQNTKNITIHPSMVGVLYQENNKIIRLDATLTIPHLTPKHKERICHLTWTKKIHTGHCTNKIQKIGRLSDRIGRTIQFNIQTPQDTVRFVGNLEHKDTELGVQGTVMVENKSISFVPIEFQISINIKPLIDEMLGKIPTTGIISFEEFLQ